MASSLERTKTQAFLHCFLDLGVEEMLTSANTAAEMAIVSANEVLEDTVMTAAVETQTLLVENTVSNVQTSTTLLVDTNNRCKY